MNLAELKKPFPANKIHWRIGSVSKKDDGSASAMALAYIDARDLYERLDEVCGMDGWQLRYPFPGCCEIGIKVGTPTDGGTEWIWKANGAGMTDVEADKGQYSDAAKRAGVPWGVAQYLYDLPNSWHPVVPMGRSWKFSKQTIKDLNDRFAVWQENYFKQKGE